MTNNSEKRYDQIFNRVEEIWKNYLNGLSESLDILQEEISLADKDSQVCTLEWCTKTEDIIKDLVHIIFNMHVPKFISKQMEDQLEELKKRIHTIYAKFITIVSPDAIFA